MHTPASNSNDDIPIHIPDDLGFFDLQLTKSADGTLSFNTSVLKRLCKASGLPANYLRVAPVEQVLQMICGWYLCHRHYGGAEDIVVESLIESCAVSGPMYHFTIRL